MLLNVIIAIIDFIEYRRKNMADPVKKLNIENIPDFEKYSPNDLESKLVAVLTNLKPRKILGFESQVMLLAAVNDSDISLIIPDKTIPVGSDIS